MAGKQLFAKFAVFALIAINLGAYYFLWPANTPNPFSADAGRTSLKREDAAPAGTELVETAPKPLAPAVSASRISGFLPL